MLGNAVDLLGEGFLSNDEIAETLSRNYGVSPCEILERKEKRVHALESLEYILGCLTEREAIILRMTAEGCKLQDIADVVGIAFQNVAKARKQIPHKLQKKAKKDPLLAEHMRLLYEILQPPESKKEMTGKVSLPAYSFERAMEVNMGMREGIEAGYKVMKTVSECHLPEYMNECFGDGDTCCMLCATCRRKKENKGRGNLGIWHTK